MCWPHLYTRQDDGGKLGKFIIQKSVTPLQEKAAQSQVRYNRTLLHGMSTANGMLTYLVELSERV